MNSTDSRKNNPRKVRFSLSHKLFLLVLVSFGLLMAGIIALVSSEARTVAHSTIQRSLSQSKQILETRLDSRFSTIEKAAQDIARDGRIQPLVYAEESASLQDQCSEFEKSLDFDILIFTNADGQILARSDNAAAVGSYVNHSALFQSALSGHSARGMMNKKGDLLQIVAIPVFDNVATEIPRGSIALGYTLSKELAQEIKNLTQSEIAFYSFRPVNEGEKPLLPIEVYSTFENHQSPLQEYLEANTIILDKIRRESDALEDVITLSGETFHALVSPLATTNGDKVGFVVALRSRTELLKPFTQIMRKTVLTAFVCLILASIIAYLIAQHISKPIVNLVSVTELIQDGQYPNPDSKARNDEVGILRDALFRMGQELKEKAELENYLAGVSDSIDEFDATKAAISQDFTAIQTDGKSEAKRPDELKSGEIVADRYRIDQLIGAGAAGMVYLANDIQLNEPLALKVVVSPRLKGAALQQFKEEIRLARRITHKNVLRTHDFGKFDGFYFISMEYVKGYDLNQLIELKGPIDIKMGILLARQMCSAIAVAHNEGIIHRDLKPQNMMINKQGILKIMDFGIALNIGKRDSDSGNKGTTIGCQPREVYGTPNFMSPEQFSAEKLDHRTDIYSLGVILFYMFTGELPFIATSYIEVARKHMNEQPPLLRSKRPEAPPELERLTDKALAKNPVDRFSNASELSNALSRLDV